MKQKIIFIILISFISSQQYNGLTFQSTIFSHLYQNSNTNICISPLSLYQSLSLLSNGAVGKTQEEIFKILIQNNKLDKKTQLLININNQQIKKYYNSKNGKVKISNAIALKERLKEEFEKITMKYDVSIIHSMTVEEINKWSSQKTNGKITKIIDYISPLTRMILLNAVYFKVNWKYKFDTLKTIKREFKNSNGKIVKVDTMINEYSKIKYFEDKNIQMIELPYEDENLSMIILLPKTQKFSSSLDYMKQTKIDITKNIKQLHFKKNVKLYLPKFEFEYGTIFNDVLKKMNMKLAFDSANANFLNLNYGSKLYVFQILQKTFIKIDESGSEASSTSLIEMRTNSTNIPTKITKMDVNHSFIFMIRDQRVKDVNKNDLLLFIGVVENLK
jgi:serpin B